MLQLGFSQAIFFNTDQKKIILTEATFKSDPLFFFSLRFDQIFKIFTDRKPVKNVPLSCGPEFGQRKLATA